MKRRFLRAYHLSMFQAYMRTAAQTAQSLGMQHAGKPVAEIDFSGNNFYQVIYTDNSSAIVFSPDSERPITVAHQRAPRPNRRPQPVRMRETPPQPASVSRTVS